MKASIMRDSGFTLVEILIVVIVLGILAAIVVPQFASSADDAYRVTALGFERALVSGVAVYLGSQKHYPANFFNWVAYSEGGSSTNIVRIGNNLRSQLTNPDDNVVNGAANIITLHFRNGLVATYTIDNTGRIQGSYAGP
jgi:prepilin-type N-terminal cleavage/methylation domain-containing protein